MKIKLEVGREGPLVSQKRGDEIEVSAAEGARMIEAGQATLVRAAAKQTATAKKKSEKAVK